MVLAIWPITTWILWNVWAILCAILPNIITKFGSIDLLYLATSMILVKILLTTFRTLNTAQCNKDNSISPTTHQPAQAPLCLNTANKAKKEAALEITTTHRNTLMCPMHPLSSKPHTPYAESAGMTAPSSAATHKTPPYPPVVRGATTLMKSWTTAERKERTLPNGEPGIRNLEANMTPTLLLARDTVTSVGNSELGGGIGRKPTIKIVY
jgi:hypothetical protein